MHHKHSLTVKGSLGPRHLGEGVTDLLDNNGIRRLLGAPLEEEEVAGIDTLAWLKKDPIAVPEESANISGHHRGILMVRPRFSVQNVGFGIKRSARHL